MPRAEGKVLAYTNALSAYRETRIRTANPGQLVVMLYDEAIKELDLALEKLGEEARPANIEKINAAIVKAQEIVTELMASLDFDAGGDIARNLFSLYNWFNRELLQANLGKEAARIKAVRSMLDELRTAWHQIAQSAAGDGARPSVQSGVNIAG